MQTRPKFDPNFTSVDNNMRAYMSTHYLIPHPPYNKKQQQKMSGMSRPKRQIG